MESLFQTLIFVICGLLFIWLGYFLFFGPPSPLYPYLPWSKKKVFKGKPGDPGICPICSMEMLKGELVKTVAFPSSAGSVDRLMHIKGCYSCLENNLPRRCPICGGKMSLDDYLISRMFERTYQKNHVHILGCNHCRKR